MALNFGCIPSPGLTYLLRGVLFYIVLNNYLGLTPYTFAASRHLSFRVTLALTLWGGLMVWRLMFRFRKTLAHLVPLGTPLALMPLMILIELIRNLIRPLTLSVRLAANIVAGHLLLRLAASSCSPLRGVFVFVLIPVFMIIVLENAVALIQGYVFRILPSLYISEINSPY